MGDFSTEGRAVAPCQELDNPLPLRQEMACCKHLPVHHYRLASAVAKAVGRDAQPRAAIRDSPCVKRTDVGDEERGFEGQVGHGAHMAQRSEPPGVRLVVLVDIASLSDTDCLLELVQRPATQRGLMVQPKRWIVERTFGWF